MRKDPGIAGIHTRSNWEFLDQGAPDDSSSGTHVVSFSLPDVHNTYDSFPHEGSSMPTLQGFKYFDMGKDLPIGEPGAASFDKSNDW